MGWRNCFVTLPVCFLLVLGCTNAQEDWGSIIKTFGDPTANVNLAPFIKIRSAYVCLLNVSDVCPAKYQLTPVGWVNVTRQDTRTYCDLCARQTRVVLWCIRHVMSDFEFQDRSTTRAINNTIAKGCGPGNGFTGKILPFNDGGMVQASKTITFASALIAWFLIYSIHM